MEQLKGIDEEEMLETMPERLHRDVAMDMHFEILKKVKLFEGCDEQLLIDLVLYLRNTLKFSTWNGYIVSWVPMFEKICC